MLNEVEAGARVSWPPSRWSSFVSRTLYRTPARWRLGTPAGTVVHTSDFELDPTPVDGRLTDLARFAEIGAEGVLALSCDSTNIERPGYSGSERILTRTFDRIFSEARGRVIVACFALNPHRIQQIADISIGYNRQVAVVGRSMAQNVDTALKLGILQIPTRGLLDIEQNC